MYSTRVDKPWPSGIREPAFAADAPRQTVSLTINADLFARVKALGVNASRIAEEALAAELARLRLEQLRAEATADVQAEDAYIARHGSFADMARQHYGRKHR